MSAAIAQPVKRARDQRLDFFRGVCLFFILIAHTQGNGLLEFIPARFGFSDATEIFVFCSGMASAIAFGSVFEQRGFALGLGRIAYRIWQVYWAHIGVLFVFAALVFGYDLYKGGDEAARAVNLHPFLADPGRAFTGIATLTYVPWFVDILPMYLVLLAMLPLVVALRRLGDAFVWPLLMAIWLAAQLGYVNLPGDPWAGTMWFFNPFGWQLLFFLGFAFMRGWLRPIPVNARLLAITAAVTLFIVPFATQRIYERWPGLSAAHEVLGPLIDKGNFGLLRLIHFMALAYIAYALCGKNGRNLGGSFVALMRKVGSQSLAVFLSGVVLARALTYCYAEFGTGFAQDVLFNAIGCGLLVATALLAAWFKSEPWNRPPGAGKTVAEESAQPAVALLEAQSA